MKEEVFKYGEIVVVEHYGYSNIGRYIGSFSKGGSQQWHVVVFQKEHCTPTFFDGHCESAEKIISYDYFSDGLAFDIGLCAGRNPTAKFFLTATNIRHFNTGDVSLKEIVDRLENEVR